MSLPVDEKKQTEALFTYFGRPDSHREIFKKNRHITETNKNFQIDRDLMQWVIGHTVDKVKRLSGKLSPDEVAIADSMLGMLSKHLHINRNILEKWGEEGFYGGDKKNSNILSTDELNRLSNFAVQSAEYKSLYPGRPDLIVDNQGRVAWKETPPSFAEDAAALRTIPSFPQDVPKHSTTNILIRKNQKTL